MSDNRPTLGFIGIGLMGLPMSLRLLDGGYPLTVLDLERVKLEPALAKGARAADSAAELARICDIVLLCVTGTAAVEEVVFGPGGIAEAPGTGKILVDHSTCDAEATRSMAERLKSANGMGWVDAPVSGGPPAAAAGKLTMMVGGEQRDIDKVRPVMEQLSGQLTVMGPTGAGQVAKMINQVLVLSNFCVLAEALKLAENGGIDAAKIPDCLAGGYADSAMLRHYYPRMVAREFEPPAGYARQALKDLDMIYDLAKKTKTPTPMSDQARMLYRLLIARGHEALDSIALLKLYDDPPV